jgi:hypothetical protein
LAFDDIVTKFRANASHGGARVSQLDDMLTDLSRLLRASTVDLRRFRMYD